MTDALRSRILRLAEAGHSVVDIAVQCLVSYQAVRSVLSHGSQPVLPSEQPSGGCQKAAEQPIERASTPRKVVANNNMKQGQAPKIALQTTRPDDVVAPADSETSRILSEMPPKQPERVSSVSETEREKRAELVREAVAAGRVTRLPPGSAAGLSDIETRFHAAPLAAEQMKGAVGTRARMLAAGRNGRRRRLLK
jgi:hypothetical protein